MTVHKNTNWDQMPKLAKAKWDLAGVICEMEEGAEFDDVCLRTLKRVYAILCEESQEARLGNPNETTTT